MEIEKLKQLLTLCWEKETCSPGLRSKRNEENPSLGQSEITALIVNNFFDGKIFSCMTSSGIHYYNIIGDILVDWTIQEFLEETPNYDNSEEITRKYLLSTEDIRRRYFLLNENLHTAFKKQNPIRKNRYKMYINQTLEDQFRLEEESNDFGNLLQPDNAEHPHKNVMVLQKKKKI